MSSATEIEMTEQLYRAIAAPRGIALATSDLTSALALAYKVRLGLADPSLASLRFVRSPIAPNELWVIRDDSGTRANATMETIAQLENKDLEGN